MKTVRPEDIFLEKPFVCKGEILKNDCDDEALIRKLVAEKSYLQRALAEEYAAMLVAMDMDSSLSPEFFSLNCVFFAGEDDLEHMKENLKTVYGTIEYIVNDQGSVIGFHTSDTAMSALAAAKEYYEQGNMYSFISHFLAFEKNQWHMSTGGVSVMLEEKKIDCETAMELKESDRYIQCLMQLGHKVYVYRSAQEHVMKRVVVR